MYIETMSRESEEGGGGGGRREGRSLLMHVWLVTGKHVLFLAKYCVTTPAVCESRMAYWQVTKT